MYYNSKVLLRIALKLHHLLQHYLVTVLRLAMPYTIYKFHPLHLANMFISIMLIGWILWTSEDNFIHF